MPNVDQRIEFALANIKDKTGKKFSVKGRDWIKDEFFTPVDGWKAWPKTEHQALCDTCAVVGGHVFES